MTNYKGHRDLADRSEIDAEGATGPVEADVVVVGSGTAAHSAAIMAARGGAEVLVLEAAEKIGGTSWRSSGGYWIPNNPVQRARGVSMGRDATLKHMASLSYPELFDPEADRLGLPQREYDLITTYFEPLPGSWTSTRPRDPAVDPMDYPGRDDGMPHYYEVATTLPTAPC